MVIVRSPRRSMCELGSTPSGQPTHLLRTVELFLRRTGTKATAFGRAAVGDPAFVSQLRNGREPRAQTAARVRAHIAAQEVC